MVELTVSDYGLVLSAVQAVSFAQDPVSFGEMAIEQVARLVPSDVVTFNEIDHVIGQVNFSAAPSSFRVPPEVEQHFAVLRKIAAAHNVPLESGKKK